MATMTQALLNPNVLFDRTYCSQSLFEPVKPRKPVSEEKEMTVEDLLSHFGFRDDIVKHFFVTDDHDYRDHQDMVYWAAVVAEKAEKAFDAKFPSDLLKHANVFYRFGLTVEASNRIVGEVHEQLLENQQPQYLLDLVLKKLDSNYYLLSYPYCSDVWRQWKRVADLPNKRTSKFSGYSTGQNVHVYNGARLDLASSEKARVELFDVLKTEVDSSTVLYHATSWSSAKKICTFGSDVREGEKNQDFSCSDGYYLHYDFESAVDWAEKKIEKEAALLVYIYQNDAYPPAGLHLKDFGDGCDGIWSNTVKAFRTGCPKDVDSEIDVADGIMGCVCVNPNDVTPAPLKREGSHCLQLCVKSKKMELWIDSCLAGVIFYDSV